MKKSRSIIVTNLIILLVVSCSGSVPETTTTEQIDILDTVPLSTSTIEIRPTATSDPLPTQAAVMPTDAPAATSEEIDMAERIKDAKVLVYEDTRAQPDLDLVAFAHRALGFLGITDVVEVGDATRLFQEQILSDTDWDLIIVVAEALPNFKGELFDGVLQEVDEGTAVILELRFLNEIASGRIAPLLEQCGLRWQKGVGREMATYDPLNYSYIWHNEEHSLVTTPNQPLAPSYPYPVWWGDAGDMLKLEPGSSSELVAGALVDHPEINGVLASCLDNRVIIQTFASHDYAYRDMIMLWENYIYNALVSHFNLNQ